MFVLGYAGSQPADKIYFHLPFGDHLNFDNTMLAQVFTGFYFLFFLIILPLLSRFEKGRELPPSIHEAVLAKNKKVGA